jgi:hypothetical protein
MGGMLRPTARPWPRFAAGILIAVLLAPIAGSAAEDAEAEAAPEPPPLEHHWYDDAVRQFDVGFDLVVIRPLAFVTWAAGTGLFLPAAIMTAPNGWDSVKEAYDRFVREPGDYVYSRPLGEF